MTDQDREVKRLLGLLLQHARILPNREEGGIHVLLDPMVYMELEDIQASIDRKDFTHDSLLEDGISDRATT